MKHKPDNNNWSALDYVISSGWSYDAVLATAQRGVSDEDAAELTLDQRERLAEFCRDRVAERGGE